MRVATYCRVSLDEQGERYGLSGQLHELRTLAHKKGYSLRPELQFADDGHSGAVLDRPALDRLRDLVRARQLDVVLVVDPDRLARKLVLQLLILGEFERHGVRVEFLTVPTDATPEGQMFLNMRGVVAEWERSAIKARTMRGCREKARRGLVVAGPIPFGYRADPGAPGKLLVTADEARTVKKIFTWLVTDGRSIRGIASELTRLGIPAPRAGRWAPGSVRNILKNSTYKGMWFFNRRETIANPKTGKPGGSHRWRSESEWIQVPVPAIVTAEVFDVAQRQLARNRGLLSGRPSTSVYLLRGLARCGQCGRKLVGTRHNGKPFYRCSGRDRSMGAEQCAAPTISATRLERWVWHVVTGILRNPDLLERKVEAHRTKLGVREVETRSELEHVERQIIDLARQERKLVDLFLGEEGMPAPAVRERLEEFGRRRVALVGRRDALRERADAQRDEEVRHDATRRYCRQALRGIDKLLPEGRQRLLRALLDSVTLRDHEIELQGVLPGRWVPGGQLVETVPNGERLFPMP
jgi:site-specific DNA recombinase